MNFFPHQYMDIPWNSKGSCLLTGATSLIASEELYNYIMEPWVQACAVGQLDSTEGVLIISRLKNGYRNYENCLLVFTFKRILVILHMTFPSSTCITMPILIPNYCTHAYSGLNGTVPGGFGSGCLWILLLFHIKVINKTHIVQGVINL